MQRKEVVCHRKTWSAENVKDCLMPSSQPGLFAGVVNDGIFMEAVLRTVMSAASPALLMTWSAGWGTLERTHRLNPGPAEGRTV